MDIVLIINTLKFQIMDELGRKIRLNGYSIYNQHFRLKSYLT